MNPITLRLLNQQLVASQFREPEEVVRYMGAMQAQEYRHRAHNNSGIFQPIIAKDGIICGNWSPFKDECQADFFLGEHVDDLQEEWTIYQKFLTR